MNIIHNMKKAIIIISVLIGLNSFAQDLTCNDFKNGTFRATMLEPVQVNWKITRKGNIQIESEFKSSGKAITPKEDLPNGIINWIDDCTYRLTFDESKSELAEINKKINSVGGVLTEVIKIEKNCFYFKSTLKIEGNEEPLFGVFCKE